MPTRSSSSNADQHDAGPKTFLGRPGISSGVQVIDIIMEQPVTANFMAGKLYRFFVREDLDPKLQAKLGDILRKNKYEIAPFLEAVFLSKDFYSQASIGAQIQRPGRAGHLDLQEAGPHLRSRRAGLQRAPPARWASACLPRPPSAGWAPGPQLDHAGAAARARQLRARRAVPGHQLHPARPLRLRAAISGQVSQRIRDGADITTATSQAEGVVIAESNMAADRDEDFNTRYASYRGWQMAIQKVKPIPRDIARLDLSAHGARRTSWRTTEQVVDYFLARFLRVQPAPTHARD